MPSRMLDQVRSAANELNDRRSLARRTRLLRVRVCSLSFPPQTRARVRSNHAAALTHQHTTTRPKVHTKVDRPGTTIDAGSSALANSLMRKCVCQVWGRPVSRRLGLGGCNPQLPLGIGCGDAGGGGVGWRPQPPPTVPFPATCVDTNHGMVVSTRPHTKAASMYAARTVRSINGATRTCNPSALTASENKKTDAARSASAARLPRSPAASAVQCGRDISDIPLCSTA